MHLQWTRLAICSSTIIQGLQSHTPTQGPAPRHLAPGKGRGEPLWADQPTESLPAPICRAASHLSGGLNGSDQPVIIDLPELLHSGSSITTDEHPHLQIDIPLPTAEKPECTTLPLGGMPATPADTIPKTPWKPRITLMAEVDDLLNRGMADDYNHESEHSTSGKEIATEADIPPPHKAEVLAPPLDTSSQASVEEVDTSMESNPINVYPATDRCSSHSNSPTVDLMGASGRCQSSC